MKRVLVLCSLWFFCVYKVHGQKFSKSYFEWWLNKCDPTISIKDVSLYVVDGLSYSVDDSLRLNQTLSAFTEDTFAGVDYLNVGKLPTAHNWNKFVILISSKKRISNKQKRSYLKIAKSRFKPNVIKLPHIAIDSTDPVLILNGRRILHYECYNILNQIRVGDISYIHISHSSVPLEYYGQNAKNGLIQIWTKKGS